MANFYLEVTQTLEFQIEVSRELEIKCTKKQIVDDGLCENVEDGDSSAWKGYVGDYITYHGGTDAFAPAMDLSSKIDALKKHLKDGEAITASVVNENINDVSWD